MEELVCDICGMKTHDDVAHTVEVYYGDGMKLERHCFYCDPPDDEDWD